MSPSVASAFTQKAPRPLVASSTKFSFPAPIQRQPPSVVKKAHAPSAICHSDVSFRPQPVVADACFCRRLHQETPRHFAEPADGYESLPHRSRTTLQRRRSARDRDSSFHGLADDATKASDAPLENYPDFTIERHLRNFRWKNSDDIARYREGLVKAYGTIALVKRAADWRTPPAPRQTVIDGIVAQCGQLAGSPGRIVPRAMKQCFAMIEPARVICIT